MLLNFNSTFSYEVHNSDGEVNTMFAPVWTMRFDTVLVSVGYFNNSNFVSQSFEIVLD